MSVGDQYGLYGEYARQRQTRAVWGLVIATAVVFVLQLLVDNLSRSMSCPWGRFSWLFALRWNGVLHGMIWQPISYMFLHGGLWHLAMNLLILVVCGKQLEEAIGSRRFLKLYLVSGAAGGIGWLLWEAVAGAITGEGIASSCVGASGAVFGVLWAVATLFPNRRITLLVMFILPVTVTMRVLAIGLTAVAVLGLVGGITGGVGQSNVAHMAHIAGGVAGFLYLRRMNVSSTIDAWRSGTPAGGGGFGVSSTIGSWAAKVRRSQFKVVNGGGGDEPTVEDIDLILDKISSEGIESLSSKEKAALERAAKARNRDG